MTTTGRFTEDSRDILESRPNIEFIEPETEGLVTITPISDDKPQLEVVQKRRKELRQFAQAINVLASAVQARADEKAKNMKIKLDLNIDLQTVQAMRRYFPDADPSVITYEQYRKVKECLRSLGREVGLKALVPPEAVQKAREDAKKANEAGTAAGVAGGTGLGVSTNASKMGGYGTLKSADGSLRPESNFNAYVIPPLDVEKFTIDLVCIFINFVWKQFIMKVFATAKIPPVGPSLADILPQQLCDPGFKMDIPGLWILGEKPPDLLVGKLTPSIPTSFNEAAPQNQQVDES